MVGNHGNFGHVSKYYSVFCIENNQNIHRYDGQFRWWMQTQWTQITHNHTQNGCKLREMALKININAGQTCTYHSDSAHGRMPTKSPFKKACTNRRLIHLAINRPIFKSHSSITSKVQAGCKGKLRGNYYRVGQNLTIKHRTCTLVKSRHIPFITSRTTAKPSKVSGAHDDDVVSMALMVMSRILITT